jgi:[ribosomal protein S18]-alanine N-acetyltransferase
MIRVRRAGAADVPQMIEIAGRSATAAQWSDRQYEQVFSSDRLVLVIEEKDQIAGFIAGRGAASEWEIENLAVTGAARRRGLGSRLITEFLHHIRCNGGREVFLEVRESNHGARAFYAKWAFIEAGRRKSYYHDPQEDALVLRFSFPRES